MLTTSNPVLPFPMAQYWSWMKAQELSISWTMVSSAGLIVPPPWTHTTSIGIRPSAFPQRFYPSSLTGRQ
jgi:hypothetical protein